MKACRNCGYKGKENFCPKCGTNMRDIIAETEDDIFVTSNPHNVTGVGYHVVCGSIVDKHMTTSYKKVYACRSCFLRMEVVSNG